jgi:hypothetical protein
MMENPKQGTLIIVRHPTVSPVGFKHVVALQAALTSLSSADQQRVQQNPIYQIYMDNPVVKTALGGDPNKKVIENALFPFVAGVQIQRLARLLNVLNARNPLSLFMDHGNFSHASGTHMVDFIERLLPLLSTQKTREDILNVKTGFYENPKTEADISEIIDLLSKGQQVAALARFEGYSRIVEALMKIDNRWKGLLSPVQDRKTSPLPQGGAFVIPTYTDNGLVLPDPAKSYIINTTPAFTVSGVLPHITNGTVIDWTTKEAIQNISLQPPEIIPASTFVQSPER